MRVLTGLNTCTRFICGVTLPAVFIQVVLQTRFVDGSNWAQVVGEQRQNTVWPQKPTFSPRWGHAMVVIDASAGTKVLQSMVVLGGDTDDSKTQNGDLVSLKVRPLSSLIFTINNRRCAIL